MPAESFKRKIQFLHSIQISNLRLSKGPHTFKCDISINVISFVEFQTRWLLKSNLFKWEITADRTVTKYIKTWVGKYKVFVDDDVEVNSFDSE